MTAERRVFWLLAAGILIYALVLRTHQLGSESFWYDEALHALAVTAPTLDEMWEHNRSHRMGMPLDYLVDRVAVSFGTSETVLRTPAVLWATLAILVWLGIARRVASRRTALLTAWLLALSAIHVAFAQEMRFYASLFFFHALSTLLWIVAVRRNRWWLWLAAALVNGLGCWFHPYVALAPATAFTDSIAQRWGRSPDLTEPSRRRWPWLLAAPAVTAAIFFAGLRRFTFPDDFEYDLLAYGKAVGDVLARGFGFLSGATPDIWGLVSAAFTALGLAVLIWTARRHVGLLGLLAGVFAQIAMIIALDVYKGYWLLARQFIHLAPALMIVTALGLEATATAIAKRRPEQRAATHTIVIAILAVALAALAMPRLSRHYASSKGTGRDVTEVLLDRYRRDDAIYVMPRRDSKVYTYYLSRVHDRRDLANRIKSASWNDPSRTQPGLTLRPGVRIRPRAFLITATNLTDDQQGLLDDLGFQELYRPQVPGTRAQGLWYRP